MDNELDIFENLAEFSKEDYVSMMELMYSVLYVERNVRIDGVRDLSVYDIDGNIKTKRIYFISPSFNSLCLYIGHKNGRLSLNMTIVESIGLVWDLGLNLNMVISDKDEVRKMFYDKVKGLNEFIIILKDFIYLIDRMISSNFGIDYDIVKENMDKILSYDNGLKDVEIKISNEDLYQKFISNIEE